MSVTTWTNLKTAVQDESFRSGDSTFLTSTERFIQMAEARMDRRLRHHQLWARYTAPTVADQETLALPASFGGLKRVRLTSTTPDKILHPAGPKFPPASSSGEPDEYSIIGAELQFFPTPDAVYTVEITYSVKVTPLGSGNADNWILLNHPDLYLYGAMIFAWRHLGEVQKADQAEVYFERILEEAIRESYMDLMSDGPPLAQLDYTLSGQRRGNILGG